MPSVVQPSFAEAGRHEEVFPLVVVREGVERLPVWLGEDVSLVGPELPRLLTLGVLLCLVLFE